MLRYNITLGANATNISLRANADNISLEPNTNDVSSEANTTYMWCFCYSVYVCLP